MIIVGLLPPTMSYFAPVRYSYGYLGTKQAAALGFLLHRHPVVPTVGSCNSNGRRAQDGKSALRCIHSTGRDGKTSRTGVEDIQ
jgi:hypothetical protein